MYTSKPEMSPIKLFHNVCAAFANQKYKTRLERQQQQRHFAAFDLVLHGAATEEVAFQMKGLKKIEGIS